MVTARRVRRRRTAGPAVERHPLGRRRPRPRRASSAARPRGPTPSGSVPLAAFTVTQAALAGRARARAAGRHAPRSCCRTTGSPRRILGGDADRVAPGDGDHRPRRRVRHGLLVAGQRVTTASTSSSARSASRLVAAAGGRRPPRWSAPARRHGRRGRQRRQHGAPRWASNIGPGDVVVSLGTSGTVFGVHDQPTAEPTGIVAGFADATGRFLPLVCTLNAARVLGAAPPCSAPTWPASTELALAGARGSRRPGPAALPRRRAHPRPAHGHRHHRRPDPRQRDPGQPRPGGRRGDALRPRRRRRRRCVAQGLETRRVLLIGGAARSEAVQRIAPDLFGAPIVVPSPGGVRRPRRRPPGRLGPRRPRLLRRRGPPLAPGRGRRPRPRRPDRRRRRRATYRELRLAMHPGS